MYMVFISGDQNPNFVKEHSDSKKKYTEDDMINMIEFLVDNIFMICGKSFSIR